MFASHSMLGDPWTDAYDPLCRFQTPEWLDKMAFGLCMWGYHATLPVIFTCVVLLMVY